MTNRLQAQPRSHQAATRLRDAIRNREDFDTSGALYGRAIRPMTIPGTGRLSRDEREIYNADAKADRIDYVVMSYATPIGWHRTDGTWHVVAESFSNTTSRHQTHVRVAVG